MHASDPGERTRNAHRTSATAVLGVCVTAIITLSLAPPEAAAMVAGHWPGLSDKAQHALAYFCAGVISLFALRRWLTANLALFVLGAGLETAQHVLAWGRHGDGLDSLANAAGLAAAVACGGVRDLVIGRYRARQRQAPQ